MKSIFNFPYFLILTFVCSLSHAQDCSTLFPLEEGVITEMTNYSPKDKPEGKVSTQIVQQRSTANGVEIQVHSIIEDKKGEIINEGDYYMNCEGGKLTIDLSSRFQGVFDNIANMEEKMNVEAEITGSMLEFPQNLSVGQSLPDANMEAVIKAGAGLGFSSMVQIKDRKVLDKETLKTPAGTFECYKISSTYYTKTLLVGVEMQTIEWIAEGVGTVKSESYNKRGKLQGYAMLTSFTK